MELRMILWGRRRGPFVFFVFGSNDYDADRNKNVQSYSAEQHCAYLGRWPCHGWHRPKRWVGNVVHVQRAGREWKGSIVVAGCESTKETVQEAQAEKWNDRAGLVKKS